MKKVLSVLFVACLCCGMIVGCGSPKKGSSDTPQKSKKKEYVSEGEIADVFSNPDKFKGKYVKMSGKIFNGPEEKDGMVAYQAWHDVTNAGNDFVLTTDDDSFNSDDYVVVDGMIAGTFEGENMMGGKITSPIIKADTIEKQSYMDAVVPTIKEVSPQNAVSEQNGISLKVDKVEFAEKETRVYITESNGTADKFSMWVYSIQIVQNGQQIEQASSSSAYDGGYATLSSDILPNASSSGVLVFPVIDSSASFQIYAEGSSDNWELDFAPFTIDVPAQ